MSSPEVGAGGGDGAEECADLRFAERVRPELERWGTGRVHGGAGGDAEDAGAASGAGELREGAGGAAVLGHGALEREAAVAIREGGGGFAEVWRDGGAGEAEVLDGGGVLVVGGRGGVVVGVGVGAAVRVVEGGGGGGGI